jgi:hypothetical protein
MLLPPLRYGFCMLVIFIAKLFIFDELIIKHLCILDFQVLESYERAYSNMVRVQQLSELEEVCPDIIWNSLFCFNH